MVNERVYSKSRNYILGTINDIKEMQNGKGTPSDGPNGKINFLVRLYYQKWEYQFTVTELDDSRCRVEIGIVGEVKKKEDKILRQFALLDSMLAANSEIEHL